jgi:NAD+ synthase (glutamine-hydrolysing)
MAKVVLQSINAGEESTLSDLRRIIGDGAFMPKDPEDIVKHLLHTAYTGTVNSGSKTRSRAK